MSIKIFKIAGVLALVCSLLLGYISYNRYLLPYNEEGRYFDGQVVWHEHSVTIYGLLSMALLIIGALSFFITTRHPKGASEQASHATGTQDVRD